MTSAAMDVPTLLGEHARTASSAEERHTFFSTLASNADIHANLFSAFSQGEKDTRHLSAVLGVMLEWIRQLDGEKRHLALQFLPSLLALNFGLRRSPGADKRLLHELDAFLLAVYNHLVVDKSGQPIETAYDILRSLSQSSLYHDGSRIDPTGPDGVQGKRGSGPHAKAAFRQATTVNAQNRMVIAEALYRSFNSVLGELTKSSLDQFVRCTQKLLQRGYGPAGVPGGTRNRVSLSSNVLLEILHGAYFCIYNGFQMGGSQIVELVRLRGSSLGSPSVLVTVNAIKTLVLTSGPSHLPATSITTPSQIAKNLITNASFRAKKMGDDIPKVANEQVNEKDINVASSLKVLANMSSINEEAIEEIMDKTPSKTPLKEQVSTGKATSKEKFREKLHNLPNLPVKGFKKRLSESERDGDRGGKGESKKEGKRKEKEKDIPEGMELRPTKHSDKRKDKGSGKSSSAATVSSAAAASATVTTSASTSSASAATAAVASTPTPEIVIKSSGGSVSSGGLQNGVQLASEIESIEQVEALIQMKKLPAETITIHSPDSGTTFF